MSAERRLIEHYGEVRRRCYGRQPEPPRKVAPVKLKPVVYRLVHSPKKRRALWDIILAEVAEKHGVSVEWLVGPSKATRIIPARFEAYRRLYEEVRIKGLPPSLTWIAAKVGRRDHSCVCNAFKKMGLR